MDNIDYMSPFYEISLAGKPLQVSRYDIRSGKYEPLRLCTLEFTKDTVPVKGMPVEVSLGYREKWLWKVFSGYVDEIYPLKDTYRVVFKDEMVKLINMKIVQTFLSASPQDIIGYGLKAAGITGFTLDSRYFHKKDFTVPNMNVMELVDAVNRAWEIQVPYFFNPEKKFFWCDYKPEQKEKPVFEYGSNIIDLEPLQEGYKLTTVLVPYISHSMEITVIHPDLPKTLWKVKRVRWYTNSKGFPRTEIYLEG